MPTHTSVKNWSIPGADGQPIFGNTHLPEAQPRGVIIIAHGFKGYKDYGMFPPIAAHAAAHRYIAHRFNFSHSGMTNNLDTFERPDLFERDTWNKQVHDLRTVIEHTAQGELEGDNLPLILLGHSRGGTTVLLTAARFADDSTFPQPAGIITIAAPNGCNFLSEAEQHTLLERGYLDSPSSRTGQMLRIGNAFLQEQLDDPQNHDVLALVPRIRCPLLIVHGENDPTVPASCAASIANAATIPTTVHIIPGPGADHVLNTPNPMPLNAAPSPQLAAALNAMIDFANSIAPV
jgi:uncharacterized protein